MASSGGDWIARERGGVCGEQLLTGDPSEMASAWARNSSCICLLSRTRPKRPVDLPEIAGASGRDKVETGDPSELASASARNSSCIC